MTAALAALDAFETQAVTSGDGTSLIVQAIRAETIAKQNPLVRRRFPTDQRRESRFGGRLKLLPPAAGYLTVI